ncbi:MAG: hypothetical protein BRD55_02515 [Bacteroidetes bacterium SW_9_63_38]|nr:MAG: hypothetical protein BRD55_02515 [Bacteroidetes bacterium SW_9_63_38]
MPCGGEFALTMQGLFFGTSGSTTASAKNSQPLGFTLIDALDSERVLWIDSRQLNYNEGAYTWDGSSWGSASSTSVLVKLTVPASTSSNLTSDLTFTLSDYGDTSVEVNSQSTFLPKTVTASLKKGDSEIFSVDLSKTNFYTATAGPSGKESQVPQRFLLKALTTPQFHTFDYESTSKKDFSFDFTLKKDNGNGDLALGILINATLTKNFDNISSTDTGALVDKLSGDLDLGPRLTLDYEFDVDGLNDLGESPSVDDVNSNFAVTVKVDGDKAGTIKVAKITQEINGQQFESRELVVEYNDGSKEAVNEAFPSASSTLSGSTSTSFSKAAGSIQSMAKSALLSVF